MVLRVTLASEISDALPTRSCLLLGTAEPVRILGLVPLLAPPEGTSKSAWTVEHARTVRGMCPGGVTVVGIYAGRSIGADPSSLQTTAALARRVVLGDGSVSYAIVLATSAKGRPIVRTIAIHDIADDGSKSGDIRTASFFPLFELTSYVKLDGVPVSTPKEITQRQLTFAAVDHINKLVDGAVISFPGDQETETIVDAKETRPISELLGVAPATGKKKGKGKGTRSATKRKGSNNLKLPATEQVSIQVLLPLGPASPDTDTDSESEHGGTRSVTDGFERILRLSGGVHVHAVVPAEATAGETLRAVREDISRSLNERVRLMFEEDDDNDGGSGGERDSESRKTEATEDHVASLRRQWPRRVIAQAASGDPVRQLGMTEYVVEGETLKDVEARVSEVLSWASEDIERAPIELVEATNDAISETAEEAVRLRGHLPVQAESDSKATAETKDVDRSSDDVVAESGEAVGLNDEDFSENDHPQWMVNLLIAAVVIVILAILLRQVI